MANSNHRIEIGDLKNVLSNLIRTDELREAFNLAYEVRNDKHEFSHSISELERQYSELIKIWGHDHAVLQSKLGIITISLVRVIGEMEEDALHSDWKTIFYEIQKEDEIEIDLPSPGFDGGANLRTEKILIPASIQNPARQEYKRLMFQIQDNFIFQNYTEVRLLCERIRNEIEPESAQMYELYVFAFLLSHGPDRFLEDVAGRKGTLLEQLVQICQRIERLQEEDHCHSKSWRQTKIEMAGLLTNALRMQILGGRNRSPERQNWDDSEAEIPLIKILEAVEMIHSHLSPTTSLHLPLAIEIFAGSYRLLSVDDQGEVRNVTAFDVLRMLENIVVELSKQEKIGSESAAVNRINRRVYSRLHKKFTQIKPNIDPETQARFWDHQKRKQLIEVIIQYKIAYAFFKDERFLVTPVRELKGAINLDWIEVDDAGKLVNNQFSMSLAFDAVSELFLMAKWHGKESVQSIKASLVRNYVAHANRLANRKMKNIGEQREHMGEAETEQRKEVIAACRLWLQCHRLSNNEVYWEKVLGILAGKGPFLWFQIGATQKIELLPLWQELLRPLADHSEDMGKILKGTYRNPQFWNAVSAGIFAFLERKYQQVKSSQVPTLDERSSMWAITEKMEACFSYYKQPEYLDLLINEFANRGKYPWTKEFIIFFKVSLPSVKTLNLNAVKRLKTLKNKRSGL